MDDSTPFGCWLRSRRKLLDLTQHALAERSDCTVGTIRKIEAGRRRPSQQLIERLATALQVSSADHRAFHQLARGQARIAPLIPLSAASNHFPPTYQALPMPLTPLIGRDAVVAAICAQLERVPLAIELAAARIRLMPLPGLLEQLDQRLAFLNKGSADASDRHQSLRAAIGWSYDLLSAEEQALLRRLGVFVGGWTPKAAEAVCGSWELGVGGLTPQP